MKIITGYRAEPHITAQQDRNVNMGIFGAGTHIVNIGSKMAATVVSANEITIADGLLVAEGCTAEIERGTSESIAVDNGEQGMLRKDLIVLRYTKDASTNIEDMELDIIKGTPASSNPATPSYTSGSIADGDTLVEFPLYMVNLNGITIASVDRLVEYAEVASKSALDSLGTTLTNSVNNLSSTLTTVSNRVGSVTLNTTAKNALAAINELLTKINTLATNLNTQRGRIDTLVTQTNGFVSSNTYNIAAGAKDYKQLVPLGMYMIVLNGATESNNVRGLYLVGVSNGSTMGIKTISAAGVATIDDVGNGIIRVSNNGTITLRYTLIRMY